MAPLGLKLNLDKSVTYYQSTGDPTVCSADSGQVVDRPMVLRLACDSLCTAPAVPDGGATAEALMAPDAPEYASLLRRRRHFCERLIVLCAGGLDAQIVQALLRSQSSSDAQYLAASVGLPGELRQELDELAWHHGRG